MVFTECHSNTNSLDVYSIRFSNCRVVYPLQIIRPIGRHQMDNQHYLDQFLTDICENGLKIDAFNDDKPKRSDVKVCKCQASYFPCEYCFSKGVLLCNKDPELQAKKKHLVKQKNSIDLQISEAEETQDNEQLSVLKEIQKTINDSLKALNRKSKNIVWPASSMNGDNKQQKKCWI